MPPELTEQDALRIVKEFYIWGKSLPDKYADNLINILAKCDIAGLVQYAFAQGVLAQKGEK